MGKNTWIIKSFLKTSWSAKWNILKGFLSAKKYYKTEYSSLNSNLKDLLKCAQCPNMCKFECPSLRVTNKEMYAPATKSRISYHMLRGDLDPSDPHSAEVPYLCTNCDGCRHWCPMDISTGKLLKGVRADLVEMDVVSDDLKAFNERVLENETTFSKDTFKKNEYHQDVKSPQVFYYMGCVMAEKKPEAVLATMSILRKLGIPFSTLANQRTCCGGPSYTVGFQKTTKKLGEKNIDLFSKADAPLIITDCPACYDTIANTYRELGLKHDFKVMTTTAYFKQLIKEGKLNPTKHVKLTITYHDPCIAARGFGDITSARFIFDRIPGLQLKEPFLNKKETQCCGMGGVSHVHHPNESEAIGRQRLEQLLKTGAEKIVTSCPACEEGFIIADGGKKERVLDISEIIDMSLE